MSSHKTRAEDARLGQHPLLGHAGQSANDVSAQQSGQRAGITRSLSGTTKRLDQVSDPPRPQAQMQNKYTFSHEKRPAAAAAAFPSSFTVADPSAPHSQSPLQGTHSQGSAPLNDAASSLVNLVNTAVPSITKAFTWKKPKDEDGALDTSAGPQPQSQVLGFFVPSSKLDRKGGGASATRGEERGDSGIQAKEEEKHDAVMGVLSKWINIGRGWGPRLFVLQGGVLSYYKLDGPDKVSVRLEVAKYRHPLLLGEDIKRSIQREKEKEAEKGRSAPLGAVAQKPLGTIHLLVSNLRASRSDDRKFYVYSGTKTLDIRAETPEDRSLWLRILEHTAAKVDESMREVGEMERSREDALGTVREDAIAGLLGELQAVGLGAERVAAFERVLRQDVLGGLQRRLKEEQHRRWKLQRRIKDLEMEKAQLESAVVQESRQPSGRLQPVEGGEEGEEEGEEGVAREGEGEEGEWQEGLVRPGPHGDSDDDGSDEEGGFFEAFSEFVESGSGRLDRARSQRISLDMAKVGFNYPSVPRRTKLPDPQEAERPVSLWNIIKDCVGKDVSRITLPVFFNEPISTLQKCAEEMEYSWLLDRAAAYGNQGDQLMRAVHVAAFALSSYACTEGRTQKPFNPLLGETFEAEYPDKGWRFIAEKMQHNPNVVACHCEGQGWRFSADCNMRIRFWGPSMQLEPLGVLSVAFDDGEVYEWSKVTTGIYGLILGKLYIDHYGTMVVKSNRNGMQVSLKFKERSIFDRNVHQVHGYAEDGSGRKLATLIGKWSEHLHLVMGDPQGRGDERRERAQSLSEAQLLWQANARSEHCGKYKFTPYCVTLNEITPQLRELLPPTDSRLRPDQRLLEEGSFDAANVEKLRLEQRQREARKRGEEGWHGRYFEQKGPHNTWTYTGNYWERRAARDWSGVKDVFAKVPLEHAPPSLGLQANGSL